MRCILLLLLFLFALPAQASHTSGSFTGTIDPANSTAIATSPIPPVSVDFDCGSPCNVQVSDDRLTGSFLMPVPNGGLVDLNYLSPTLEVLNDGNGNLSGSAFGVGNAIGQVRFEFGPYQVVIDPISGYFSGYAYSENAGLVEFLCPGSACVRTTWHKASGSLPPSGGSITGTCGSAHNVSISTTPVSGFCSVGSVIGPVPNYTGGTLIGWKWQCVGAYGGATAACSAPKSVATPPPPASPSVPPTTPSPTVPAASSAPTSLKVTLIPGSSGITEAPVAAPVKKEVSEKVFSLDYLILILAILGLVAGISTRFLVFMLVAPFPLADLYMLPLLFWQILGFRKSYSFGTVFDSITEVGLGPAMISLRDSSGREIETTISDSEGKYGFIAGPGVYTLAVEKSGYQFPSANLIGQTESHTHMRLYLGGPIEVKEEQGIIAPNIPIDQTGFSLGSFIGDKKKITSRLFRRRSEIKMITMGLFSFGFLITIASVFMYPSQLHNIMLAAYILVWGLRLFYIVLPRPKGALYEPDGLPLSFASLKIYSADRRLLVERATDVFGEYRLPLPNGFYYVKIEEKNPDGTYTRVHEREPAGKEIEEGIIN